MMIMIIKNSLNNYFKIIFSVCEYVSSRLFQRKKKKKDQYNNTEVGIKGGSKFQSDCIKTQFNYSWDLQS